MARESVELGAVPAEEECEQVGTAGYNPERARAECRAYIGQLLRENPGLPEGVCLRVKSNPHDFGSYLEVVTSYSDGDEGAAEAAWGLERTSPARWDEIARAELGLAPAGWGVVGTDHD